MLGGSACGSWSWGVHGGLAAAGPNKTLKKSFFFPGQAGAVGLSWAVGSVPAGSPFLSPALGAARGVLSLSHGQQRGQSSACSWELTPGLDLLTRTGDDLSSNGIQDSSPLGAVLASKTHPSSEDVPGSSRVFPTWFTLQDPPVYRRKLSWSQHSSQET